MPKFLFGGGGANFPCKIRLKKKLSIFSARVKKMQKSTNFKDFLYGGDWLTAHVSSTCCSLAKKGLNQCQNKVPPTSLASIV